MEIQGNIRGSGGRPCQVLQQSSAPRLQRGSSTAAVFSAASAFTGSHPKIPPRCPQDIPPAYPQDAPRRSPWTIRGVERSEGTSKRSGGTMGGTRAEAAAAQA